MRECLWVACVSFTFFGMRAVTGLGACCLFPQRVLAVIPLVEDAQVRGLHGLQEGREALGARSRDPQQQ